MQSCFLYVLVCNRCLMSSFGSLLYAFSFTYHWWVDLHMPPYGRERGVQFTDGPCSICLLTGHAVSGHATRSVTRLILHVILQTPPPTISTSITAQHLVPLTYPSTTVTPFVPGLHTLVKQATTLPEWISQTVSIPTSSLDTIYQPALHV